MQSFYQEGYIFAVLIGVTTPRLTWTVLTVHMIWPDCGQKCTTTTTSWPFSLQHSSTCNWNEVQHCNIEYQHASSCSQGEHAGPLRRRRGQLTSNPQVQWKAQHRLVWAERGHCRRPFSKHLVGWLRAFRALSRYAQSLCWALQTCRLPDGFIKHGKVKTSLYTANNRTTQRAVMQNSVDKDELQFPLLPTIAFSLLKKHQCESNKHSWEDIHYCNYWSGNNDVLQDIKGLIKRPATCAARDTLHPKKVHMYKKTRLTVRPIKDTKG